MNGWLIVVLKDDGITFDCVNPGLHERIEQAKEKIIELKSQDVSEDLGDYKYRIVYWTSD